MFLTSGMLAALSDFKSPGSLAYDSGSIRRFFAHEILERTVLGLYFLSSSPDSLIIVFIRLEESLLSYMVKRGLYPMRSASVLRICENTLWNVPICKYRAALIPTMLAMRSRISLAAVLVKVSAKIFHGSMPLSIRYATLVVSTRVFPAPAPAITNDGPSMYSTAARWLSSRESRYLYDCCIFYMFICFRPESRGLPLL